MHLSVRKNYVRDNCYYLALNWDNDYNVDFNSIMCMLKIDEETSNKLREKYNIKFEDESSFFLRFKTEQDVLDIIEELEPYIIMSNLVGD